LSVVIRCPVLKFSVIFSSSSNHWFRNLTAFKIEYCLCRVKDLRDAVLSFICNLHFKTLITLLSRDLLLSRFFTLCEQNKYIHRHEQYNIVFIYYELTSIKWYCIWMISDNDKRYAQWTSNKTKCTPLQPLHILVTWSSISWFVTW
jgi:hypothetical protein